MRRFPPWGQRMAGLLPNDEFDARAVAHLVGCVYESAIDPPHWHAFVGALSRIHPQSRITLFGHDDACPTADLAVEVNYDPDALSAYAGYYARRSPFVARGRHVPSGQAFAYQSLVGDDAL